MKFSLAIVFSSSDLEIELMSCLKSCFEKQTRQPNELLLVLNGLESNRASNLKRELSSYPVRYFESSALRPLSEGLNEAIENSSFEYVARIDPDDVSHAQRFKQQLAFLESNKDVDVLGCAAQKGSKVRIYPTSHGEIANAMRLANVIAHPTVVAKKSVLMNGGGYPNILKSQDYLFWLRLIKAGFKFANLPDVLVELGQDGLATRRGFKYYKSEVAVLKIAFQERLIPLRFIALNLVLRFVLRSLPLPIRRVMYGS